MKAYVYSMESLNSDIKDELYTGLEMVAAYIGETVVTKLCRVRLATDYIGHVEPSKIGTSKLDKLVELHVMAVPMSLNKADQAGLAYMGEGVSYVDVSPFRAGSAGKIVTSTAHEVAHSLGFLKDGAVQTDPQSSGHCKDQDCILNKNVIEKPIIPTQDKNLLKRGVKAVLSSLQPAPEPQFGYQFDFCQDCKNDLHLHGPSHLDRLRSNRLLYGI